MSWIPPLLRGMRPSALLLTNQTRVTPAGAGIVAVPLWGTIGGVHPSANVTHVTLQCHHR